MIPFQNANDYVLTNQTWVNMVSSFGSFHNPKKRNIWYTFLRNLSYQNILSAAMGRWSDYKKSSLASDGFMTSYSRSFWSLSFLKVTNGSRYKWLPRIKGRKWNALHLGRIYVPGRNRNRFSFKIDCRPQSCQFPADHFFRIPTIKQKEVDVHIYSLVWKKK